MLATLIQAMPEARRFFMSERWGGYARSSPGVDAVQNPVVMPVLFALWLASAAAMTFGWAVPWSALVNVVLCRYFFIHMRWKGVLRGMGAPGFMAYWTGAVVFILEFTSRYAPQLRNLALLAAQVDFALIMLSAGVYKLTAGYPRNHGMELGLCNPMWGYWWRWYVKRPPNHPMFWVMNYLAWGTEVGAALLMLVPSTRELGGLLIACSFAFIVTQIRLGFLCEMVIIDSLLFVQRGSVLDRWIAPLAPAGVLAPSFTLPFSAVTTIEIVLWGYLVLLPVAHAGLFYNFYARRPLPSLLQRALDRYTNAFGIMIWRVFSVDLVNFFIRIHSERRDGTDRVPAARLGSWPRFNHVGEMICITSLFTTMKYYPGQDALFRERLLRYARTIPRAADRVLVFEYVSVVKRPGSFDWVPVAEYRVDVDAGTIGEKAIDPAFSTRAAHADSPVHEGALPGSYAPANR